MASQFLHSDYITQTTALLKLSRLILHIKEVTDILSNFASRSTADGFSYNRFDLQKYLDSLKAEQKELEAATGTGVTKRSGMIVRMRLN